MATIHSLMEGLNERTIAGRVGIAHDEARMRYHLNSNTVQNYDAFKHIVTDYYNYHYTNCVSGGGRLPVSEAYGRARELLEREYRKRGGDIVSAFNDAHDGTNGGMRNVLDTIADGLKAEVIERYITELFDRHISPNNWEGRVDIIRQFISYCGDMLSSSIGTTNPQQFAHDYTGLIRSYVDGLQKTSSMFRRYKNGFHE